MTLPFPYRPAEQPVEWLLDADGLIAGYTDERGNYVATNFTGEVAPDPVIYNFVSVTDEEFGAVGDGVTDDTAAIQAAIDAQGTGKMVWFPKGTYKITSGLLVASKTDMTLAGEHGAKLLFTDGAYNGIYFSGNNSGRHTIRDLLIFGSTNVAPTITLIKISELDAYVTIENCDFYGAACAVRLGRTYIIKLIGNRYSNCDVYVNNTSDSGTSTDVLLLGETYGTCIEDTSASLVQIGGVQTRLVGCYFETMVAKTKYSIEVVTGAQRAAVTGCQFSDSAGILCGTSTNTTITGNQFSDCDNHFADGVSTPPNYLIRVAGGGTATIVGNTINFPNGTTMAQVISISGGGVVTGNEISRGVVGIQCSGTAIVSGNYIANCTTGISFPSGAADCRLGENVITGGTTRLLNASAQVIHHSGTGTPEAALTAGIGSIYVRTDGGASTTLYIKESGTGNTGWVAK